MARLVPNIDVETISNKPERDVARALVSILPENVIVYHSYPWLKAEHNKTEKINPQMKKIVRLPDLPERMIALLT